MRPDTGGLRRFPAPRHTESESGLSSSPDGRRVVFGTVSRRSARLYVANADGSRRRPLTTPQIGDGLEPAWSPDGRRVAYSLVEDGEHTIYVVGADGTGLRLVSKGPRDGQPAWSPDGRRLVFTSASPEGAPCRD